MPRLQVRNLTRQTVVVEHGRVADTPWSRLIGLMGKRDLREGDGLLLRGEGAIHTFGMRIAIDVLFLDGHGRVLRAISAMPPMRIGPLVRGTQNVLELPVGTIERSRTRTGDVLDLRFL